jgi:DNA-binding NarL/FixJ family response regulator
MRFSPCHTPGNGDEADRGASKTRSCRACGQDDEEEELQRALMDRSHRGAVLLTLADLERTEGPCLGGVRCACGVVDTLASADEAAASGRREGPLRTLTPRERDAVQLVAEGRSNKGIGDRLAVSERAVQKHVTSIFAKFGLSAAEDDNRRILAVLAYMNR